MAPQPDAALFRRYRIPGLQRWLNVSLAGAWCVIALASRAPLAIYVAVLLAVFAAVSWFVPTTILDEKGVRRPFGRPGRRRISWSQAEDAVLGQGMQQGGVYLRLHNQALVALNGLGRNELLPLCNIVAAAQPERPRQQRRH